MNIAKEGLALLVLHPTADVQLHRECISHIGTAWDIPFGDTQEVISLLDRELDAIHAAEKNGTVTHVLPEEELPMNASGLETLDNIWDLFETSLRVDSPYARTRAVRDGKVAGGVSEPAGLDRKDVGGKAGMDGTSQLTTPHRRSRPQRAAPPCFASYAPCEPLCAALGARVESLHPGQASALFAPAFAPPMGNCAGNLPVR
ncbi:MAG: hypothetical protein ACLR4W_08140 [Oscillospiraceae bacterium]